MFLASTVPFVSCKRQIANDGDVATYNIGSHDISTIVL